jgi:hypothetical protein
MGDEQMIYRPIHNRLQAAEKLTACSEQDKLLAYLFLCLAHALQRDRDRILYQDGQWSDPDTTFSMVLYRSGGETHDYCCSCIEALGGEWQRECGPVTTAYTESRAERDALKSGFISLLAQAEQRLSRIKGITPQEYFFLQTNPVIEAITSTDHNHFVVLRADVQDNVDMLCLTEALEPWADYERIRDHFEIIVQDDGMAEIRVIFYRLNKQRKFVRYLKKMGVDGFAG